MPLSASGYTDQLLGVHMLDDSLECAVWAPAALAVEMELEHDGEHLRRTCVHEPDGRWTLSLSCEFEMWRYRYIYHFADGVRFGVDPYARAVTPNGTHGILIDPAQHFDSAHRLPATNPGSVVIYEAHIRDLTIGPDNGIDEKGKFLGLCQAGTSTAAGMPTGIDYLASLGITHVQLLPVFDFGSVDETADLSFNSQYNWGYDPVHYNVPEGSYVTDPSDPLARIGQLRTLISALHERGLRVIMDVVYNHVYDAATHPLEQAAPGYYFRQLPDGSLNNATGCGNETASEQPMMRRFIVDSVAYWAQMFGFDGFRFDLMGIHDVSTMQQVRARLDQIDPAIMILGEGWVMGEHHDGADLDHAQQLPGIAMFNDGFRDGMKGSVFDATAAGFVSNHWDMVTTQQVLDGIFGGLYSQRFLSAAQSVVYNEAHDNLTLYDKLAATPALVHAEEGVIQRRFVLACTIQMLAHGVQFIHAGQEFCRTKFGDENSYRSPDRVNVFDYDRAQRYHYVFSQFRALLNFRRHHTWLHETSYDSIRRKLSELHSAPGHIRYQMRQVFYGENDCLVFINARSTPWVNTVRAGKYKVHIEDGYIHDQPRTVCLEEGFVVQPLSVVVLECLRKG